MALLYKDEHISCTNYAKGINKIFSLLEIPEGENIGRRFLNTTFLIILLEGELEIQYGTNKYFYPETNNIFLLPASRQIIAHARKHTTLLLCAFSSDLKLCSRFSVQQLSHYVAQTSFFGFYSLKTDDRIKSFVSLLIKCLKEGLGCIHYHLIKRDELFLYLRAGYSQKELACFFCPILGKDLEFKDFVLMHCRSVFDVKEFALRANMSLSTFNRRFKETFNDTARNWLLLRKQEFIKEDITLSNMSFSEIAEKYQFSSAAYLTTFCKKYLGNTPNELRKSATTYTQK